MTFDVNGIFEEELSGRGLTFIQEDQIFSDAFKPLVESVLGWPVLVVVPCRDFIYVVANKSPLVGRLGPVVVKEFRNSGYPITTEVLRISDGGIGAIGNFSA